MPLGVHPVFVTVLKTRIPDDSALEREIARLTSAVAGALNRPKTNVHILYQAAASGRMAFGSRLVR